MTKHIENGPIESKRTRRPSTGFITPVETDTQVNLSESTSCKIDKLIKFKAGLNIYSELLLDEGKNPEIIKISTTQLYSIFTTAAPKRQHELSNEIIQTVNAILKGRFYPDLNLLHNLSREGGQNSTDVGKDQETWRDLFENSSKENRLQIIRMIREENENILMQRFDSYLKTWKQALSDNPTISQEEAIQQTDKLKQTFDGASRRGKVGLSKQLRGKIEATSIGKFTAHLSFYKELLGKDTHQLNPDEPLSAEDWIRIYQDAPIGEKDIVINKLHDRINDIITFRQ